MIKCPSTIKEKSSIFMALGLVARVTSRTVLKFEPYNYPQISISNTQTSFTNSIDGTYCFRDPSQLGLVNFISKIWHQFTVHTHKMGGPCSSSNNETFRVQPTSPNYLSHVVLLQCDRQQERWREGEEVDEREVDEREVDEREGGEEVDERERERGGRKRRERGRGDREKSHQDIANAVTSCPGCL